MYMARSGWHKPLTADEMVSIMEWATICSGRGLTQAELNSAVSWFTNIVATIQLADKVLSRQVGLKIDENGQITFIMGEKK